MNIITVQDIPFVKTTVKTASQPYQLFCKSKDGYTVLCDGSIIKLYAGNELIIPEVEKMVMGMGHDCTIQIYKHHSGNDMYYVAIQIHIDYSFFKRKWKNIFSDILNGPHKVTGKLRSETEKAVKNIEGIKPVSFKEVDISENGIISYLYDGNKIVSNLSLIKAGENKFATTISINNIATIPTVSNIIQEFEYMCITTLARPGITFERDIKKSAANMAHLISSLSTDKKSDITQVHTMQNATEYVHALAGAISYVNVKYILQSHELDNLNIKAEQFCKVLNDNGIVVYKPSVSGLNEYVAAFPGNGIYGEHYYQIIQQMGALLVNRVNSL